MSIEENNAGIEGEGDEGIFKVILWGEGYHKSSENFELCHACPISQAGLREFWGYGNSRTGTQLIYNDGAVGLLAVDSCDVMIRSSYEWREC